MAVVGAGAAGTMAAIFAADAGADTVLLESTADGGRKILISGGGRCNILPARLDESRFVTDSSVHSLRNILRSWPLAEQIAFFDTELDLRLVEETETGKLFPSSNRARDVRDGLLALAARRGARLLAGARVTALASVGNRWRLERGGQAAVEADAVVIATGGLSVPATGSTGFGLETLAALGHTIHSTYPALTPIVAQPAPFGALAGVSLPVTLTAADGSRRAGARGGFLFTHRGYSGPSVLDVSHVVTRSERGAAAARIRVQWCDRDEDGWTEVLSTDGGRGVLGVLREALPERLATALLRVAEVEPSTRVSQLRREERLRLVETLVRCDLPWTSHAGYQKAEVTGGGVSLAEVDPRTLESRKAPGVFICGEVLDAFGPIGGYNFAWAWATGRAAGLGAARGAA